MMAIHRLFELMAEKNASDLFLAVGSPINIKINGISVPINQQVLDGAMVKALLAETLTPDQMKQLQDEHELNMAIPVAGVGSFRLSAFKQRGSVSAVIRFIPHTVPRFENLALPPVLQDIIMEKRGLVLMVGATGSGKSTTLAAMIDLRNEQRSGHILTIEEPIEFLFRSKKSIVNQREVGSDARSLQIALKNALRQAPDVILIGEIRDKETMTAAIQYAQSGHLVLATLHANNSYHALNRVISFYPLENRPALLADLATSLKSIISQRLVRKKVGGRTPAVEVMMNTRHISELIEKGEVNAIKEAMEKSLAPGSQTFEQSLFDLINDDVITQDEALINADSANNLLWLINNTEVDGTRKKREEPQEAPKESGPSFTEFTLNV
jgi:twitching motility protein PilU